MTTLADGTALAHTPVRRVGVRVEKLVPKSETYQQPRLDEPERGWEEAESAIDRAVLRFGPHAVQRARLARRADVLTAAG